MFDANLRKLSRIRTSAGTFCSGCHWALPFSGSVIVRLTAAVNVFLFLAGCAVVGDVLPPTLNLPMRATDMAVIEHGDKLVITFKVPGTTTEGMLVRHPPEIDLRVGPAPGDPNDAKGWAARATAIPVKDPQAEVPVGPWVNQKVGVAGRLLKDRGK